MMLKRVLVTAFACLFVVAFGLGQAAYGAGGSYLGEIKTTGKMIHWDTKANNFKIKIKTIYAELDVNGTTGRLDAALMTVDYRRFTCTGEMGEQGFFLDCNNTGAPLIYPKTQIIIYGKVKENQKNGELKFKGKALINVNETLFKRGLSVGDAKMTGKFEPVQ